MNRRWLSSVLCTVLLGMLVVVPVASWVMDALSMPVNNVLCAEGFRWLALHALEFLTPSYIAPVIALVIAWGCVESSGFVGLLRRGRRTVNENLGVITASTVFVLLFLVFLVPIFNVHSAMRSVTGQLFPSPWFICAPLTLSVIVFLSMLSFCLFARKESIWRLTGFLLSAGISRHIMWIIDLSILNLLIEIVRYVGMS